MIKKIPSVYLEHAHPAFLPTIVVLVILKKYELETLLKHRRKGMTIWGKREIKTEILRYSSLYVFYLSSTQFLCIFPVHCIVVKCGYPNEFQLQVVVSLFYLEEPQEDKLWRQCSRTFLWWAASLIGHSSGLELCLPQPKKVWSFLRIPADFFCPGFSFWQIIILCVSYKNKHYKTESIKNF